MRHFEKIRVFLKDETGATAIEYAVIAAGIGVAILGAVNALGTNLNTKWESVATAMR